MAIQPLQVGQPHSNLKFLVDFKLTRYSSNKTVMTEEAIKLLIDNYWLKPSSFEYFRAKTIGVIVGGTLPITVSAIFGFVLYGLYQAGGLTAAYQRLQAIVSSLATKVFATITATPAAVAASTGGAFVATYALTRAPVYDAIGSFFGSLFGSFSGVSLANMVKETQESGYNWWYSKYHFAEREKTVQSNEATIVKQLTDTYNDMANTIVSELGQQSATVQSLAQIKVKATTLKQKLPDVQRILKNQGIPDSKCQEITFQLEKAIGRVLDS